MSKDTVNIVVSLELARELKEVGYTQNTIFHLDTRSGNIITLGIDRELKDQTMLAMPTTDELLNELPHEVYCVKDYTTVTTDPDSPQVFYYRVNYGLGKKPVYFESRFLTEALAKMYIYLKKEGLLT